MKVHIEDGETTAPEGPHFKVASNGAFIVLSNPAFDAVVTVTEIPVLQPVKEAVHWKLPPIPRETIARIVQFFHEVSDRHGTEVAVLLHYGPQSGWVVTVPPQEVTPGHVDYQMGDAVVEARKLYPDARCVGTMHSHVTMSAFHSGVDDRDEAVFDGLHVTIGMVDKWPKGFDMDAEIIVRGRKFKAPSKLWAEGIVAYDGTEDEDEDEADEGGEDFDEFGMSSGRGWRGWWRGGGPSSSLVEGELPAVPEEWHEPVRVKSFASRVVDYSTRGRRRNHGHGH